MRAARAAGLILGAAAVALGLAVARPVDPALLAAPHATRVLDRNGAELAIRNPDFGRRAAFAPTLVAATLAAEDHRFYHHVGIDPVAVARAAVADLRAGSVVEGGSTLTQQLARNLTPRPPGLWGKLDEALFALRIEAHSTKEEILSQYLSRVYYGNGAIGADAASWLYFDRDAGSLSLAQAATLAAIPRRPADLDPLRFPERVQRARDRVLDRLGATELASAGDVEAARAEPLQLFVRAADTRAPHFVRRVFQPDAVVRTTLDLRLQDAAEAAVSEVLEKLKAHDVDHAAVLVVENRTRAVRAYVGSGRWSAADGQVDGVMAPRSPGSALKPFLYGLALEEGATLADVIADTPGGWRTTHGTWRPTNYGERSAGPVTLREALATSLNVPAVRLAEQVGVVDLHRRLTRLGLTTLDDRPDHYGLGLPIGDGEARLDELVAAYAALGTGGNWRPLRLTEDTPRTPPVRVMDPVAAWQILDALDDPDARAAAFGHDSVLEPDYPLAAKTGTSTGYRDNWAIGVTPRFTVGVWVGNFDGRPMVEVSGITGAGPILRRVMDAAMEGAPREPFPRPDGLVAREICPLSGLLHGPDCPTIRAEWFREGQARDACGWHTPAGLVIPDDLSSAPSAASRRVSIAFPAPDAHYWLDPARPVESQGLPLRAANRSGTAGRWFVDGTLLAEVAAPFTARWIPSPGDHLIELEVDGEKSEPVRIAVATAPPSDVGSTPQLR